MKQQASNKCVWWVLPGGMAADNDNDEEDCVGTSDSFGNTPVDDAVCCEVVLPTSVTVS